MDNRTANPKYLQIALSLREEIGETLKAGDYLPSERALCERFGVNLKTVRSALALLQQDGLVEKLPSRGTVVLPPVQSEPITAPALMSSAVDDGAGAPDPLRTTVALVMPLESHLVAVLARGVERELRRRGYRLQLAGTYTMAQMQEDVDAARDYERLVLQSLERDGVAGAIWWSVFGVENREAAQRLRLAGIPIVLIDNPVAGLACDWVGIDDYGASAQATQHLLDLGHRNIGFYTHAVTSAMPAQDAERLLGYLDTMRGSAHDTASLPLSLTGLSQSELCDALTGEMRAGLYFASQSPPQPLPGGEGLRTMHPGAGASDLVSRQPRPSAVVVADNHLAEALQADLERRGVRVPEDMAIVAIGDIAYYTGRSTNLTCIHQPFELMAQRAARLLLQRVRTPSMPLQQLQLPAYLVIRQSSRPASQARGRRAIPGVTPPLTELEEQSAATALAAAEVERAVEEAIARGPFLPDWESLANRRIPAWYEDGKFGIFIHWGVYSVPAFGSEWYPRNMYQKGSAEFDYHIKTYGAQDQFGYKDFIPHLTFEGYDPRSYARLFKEAGARFVVPVAEHHDGFAMYESRLGRWNAASMGPKRDVLGELAAAVEAEGLVFGASSHRAEHFWFYDGGRKFASDVRDPDYADLYGPAEPAPADWHNPALDPPTEEFLQDWLLRTCEMVDRYRPQLVWFDFWIQNHAFKPYLQKFAAFYYNRGAQWGKEVAINYKYDAFPEGTAVFDMERGQLAGIRAQLWQNDTSVSRNSWGYIRDQEYKSVNSLIGDLVDIVSKNGAMLLNVGPKADGTIPDHEQRMLREIGAWLAVNGEAIYGTRPWRTYGEGPTRILEGAFTDASRAEFTSEDIRFTTRGDALYAIGLAWPIAGSLRVESLPAGHGGEVEAITLLGHDGPIAWSQEATGLLITLPNIRPCEHAYTLKIVFAPGRIGSLPQ